jgi:Ni,Fe-hydrogenase I cytochrome b subunit
MSKAFAAWPSAPSYQPKTKQYNNTISTRHIVFAYGLVAINVVLLMAYLFGVNNYASQGYEIKKIQTKNKILSDDNKKLNLKISEQSSLAVMHNDLANSEFVPVNQAKYVQTNQFTQR